MLERVAVDLRGGILAAGRTLAALLPDGVKVGAVEEGVAQILGAIHPHEAARLSGVVGTSAVSDSGRALGAVEERHRRGADWLLVARAPRVD